MIATRRDDQRLHPKAFVIGLRLHGEIKAYPVTHLRKEPVANDAVGSTPVVVVFQPRNATGLVYSRRVGERILTLFRA